MRMQIAAWLLCQALVAAAEQTVPLESCQIHVSDCPGESSAAPADWEEAAQLSCERFAPHVCLPLDQSCKCAKRSWLTSCKLVSAPLPGQAQRRSAYAQTEMQGLDANHGPWTLVIAFPYCSCPAHAVFNAKGQCVCEAGARYAAELGKCLPGNGVTDRTAQASVRPRL